MKKRVGRLGGADNWTEKALVTFNLGLEGGTSAADQAGIVATVVPAQFADVCEHGDMPSESLLRMLQAENAELRDQVVELALEILDLRIGAEADAS